MPRHARLRIAGLPFHVIQRGNNRSPCFMDAYVLMTNHVHLLLTPERVDGVSMLMKNLGQRFVQHINRTHHRTGSLWEGRFRSSIVDSDAYLFRCHRYIELNPVRAGMVPAPEQYPWSSHGFNASGVASSLLVPHQKYLELGSNAEERTNSYRRMFGTALGQEEIQAIRDAANGGFVLGDKAFATSLERMLKRRTIPGVGGRPRKRKRGG